MSTIREAITRLLRGRRASRLLEIGGIDSKRYWLLTDLFGELSERGEMLDQLGRNGVALRSAAWLYFGLSAFLSLLLVAARTDLAEYASVFLVFTAFVLLSILLSETGNSLVNPVEGLVLASQPINGATYTAAKLTHLVRIILYLVPGLNAVPAFAGLMLKESRWFFPFQHLLVATAVGTVAAMLCCALFGWLIRFIPVRRLKAAGQLAGTLPFMAMPWMSDLRGLLAHSHLRRWLPVQAPARWGLLAALGALVLAIVVLGIRSLSADYLLRVSSMVRGGAALGATERRSRIGEIVARFFGGQASRAGFAFVSRMMLRDWQFRRQMFPLLILPLVALAPLYASNWRVDPFSGRFAPIHLLPHILAAVLFFICVFLPYGNDYKGAWIFLLAPARAFAGFARGIYALLWIEVVVIPHLILLPFLAWFWGVWHAGLSLAYSLAAASVYLALELRLIDGAPFSKQADTTRGAILLPLMMIGGAATAAAVALQYFLVFRSPAIVMITTAVVGAVAYFLTRSSLGAFETSIRYHLGLISAESGPIYKEVAI
ncbi:MAG TPA: hypothetical protein VJN43_02065 [Bryobacteraceae bacterium]|nr:hypothetical protein [Bryobacteraceae bacterium]